MKPERKPPRPTTWIEEQKYKKSSRYVNDLMKAVKAGNREKIDIATEELEKQIRLLGSLELDYQLIIDHTNKDYILHAAAQSGDVYLFEEMANRFGLGDEWIKNLINENNQTLLFPAVRSGNLEMVKHLIKEYQLDPHVLDSNNDDGESLLHVAARYGHCDIFRYLSKELKVKDPYKNSIKTALAVAVRNGQFEMVKMLVQEFGYQPAQYFSNREGSLLRVAITSKTATVKDQAFYLASPLEHQKKLEDHDRIVKFLRNECGVKDLPPRGSSILSKFSGGSGLSSGLESIPEQPTKEMVMEIVTESFSSTSVPSGNSTPTADPDRDSKIDRFGSKLSRIMTYAFYKVTTRNSGDLETIRQSISDKISRQVLTDDELLNKVLSLSISGEKTIGEFLLSDAKRQFGETFFGNKSYVFQRGNFSDESFSTQFFDPSKLKENPQVQSSISKTKSFEDNINTIVDKLTAEVKSLPTDKKVTFVDL